MLLISSSSDNEQANEYTKVDIIAAHIPWIILKEKTIIKNKGSEGIFSRNEYDKVHVASKKVEKYNNFILENFLHNFGIKGVMIQLDIAYVLIIQPNNASLMEKSFSRTGKRGKTIEYPIPENIFIQINSIIDLFIFWNNQIK